MTLVRVLCVTGVLLLVGAWAITIPAADDLRRKTVTDLDGRPMQPFSGASARAVVLVFTRSDCPIANRYAPDLQRLLERATAASVDFWLVFVDPAESASAIREHLHAYSYTGRALRDPEHELVRAAGATIAPQAAVFLPGATGPRLVYRGRIDDRYLAPGRMRPAATTHELENVIDAVRTGTPLAFRETQAVGCVIADLR